MNNGFIKLYKKMENWQWYKESTTLHLFIDLLLDANYEDSKFKFETIKRGQCLTSLKRMSMRTGLSYRQIRTCLDKLQKSGEIDKQSTNRYSIITIKNYNDYQDYDKQKTNKRQTTDNIKEYKEEKELNNNMNIIINNWDKNLQCDEIAKTTNERCFRRSSYNINGKNYCNQHSRNVLNSILCFKEKKDKTLPDWFNKEFEKQNENIDELENVLKEFI